MVFNHQDCINKLLVLIYLISDMIFSETGKETKVNI